jgi:hypothetical protein
MDRPPYEWIDAKPLTGDETILNKEQLDDLFSSLHKTPCERKGRHDIEVVIVRSWQGCRPNPGEKQAKVQYSLMRRCGRCRKVFDTIGIGIWNHLIDQKRNYDKLTQKEKDVYNKDILLALPLP